MLTSSKTLGLNWATNLTVSITHSMQSSGRALNSFVGGVGRGTTDGGASASRSSHLLTSLYVCVHVCMCVCTCVIFASERDYGLHARSDSDSDSDSFYYGCRSRLRENFVTGKKNNSAHLVTVKKNSAHLVTVTDSAANASMAMPKLDVI